jgi:hypothetical protein
MDLTAIVEEFASRIQSLLEAQSMERAKAEILGALGMGAPRKPGRPSKAALVALTVAPAVAVKASRRKLPPQYCPVPYCRNLAAPAFGMVCSKHRDVSKAKIKEYREARRAKKEGVKLATKAPPKRAKRVAKTTRASVATKTKTKKKAPMKRAAPAAKKAAKRRSSVTKKQTEKVGPIVKEAAPVAPAMTAA